MPKTARVVTEVAMDDSAFHAGVRRVLNANSRLLKDLNASGGAVAMGGIAAGALAASAAFVTLGAAIKEGLDVGGKFADLSKKIGDLPGSIAVVSKAFEAGGLGADEVAGAVGRMQKALVGGSDAFGKLGLNAAQLQAMAPTAALIQVGNAIAGIKDPAEQTAMAMELFGKSGAALKQVFGDEGALALATEALGSMPAILNESGGAIDDLGDRVGMLATKWQAFSVGITAGLAPVLMPLLDKMIAADTAAFGAGLGEDIAEAFKGRTISEAITTMGLRLGATLALAGKAAAEAIAGELANAIEGPSKAFRALLELGKPGQGIGGNIKNAYAAATSDEKPGAALLKSSEEHFAALKNLWANTANVVANGVAKTEAAAVQAASASPNAAASAGLDAATGGGTGGGSAGARKIKARKISRDSHVMDQFGVAGGNGTNPDPMAWKNPAVENPMLDAIDAQKSLRDSLTSQSREGFLRSVREGNYDTRTKYQKNYLPNAGNFTDDGHGGSRIDGDGVRRAANLLNVGRKDDGHGGSRLDSEPESMLRTPAKQSAWVRRRDESEGDFDSRVNAAKGKGAGGQQGDPNAGEILKEIRKWSERGKT